MASGANNTDSYCAQALDNQSIKLHRGEKKSKQLCYLTCDTLVKSQALPLYTSINM